MSGLSTPPIELATVQNRPSITNAFGFTEPILKATTELFPGKVQIESIDDPDSPGRSFIVLTVFDNGDPRERMARSVAWHRRVGEILGYQSAEIKLSVMAE